MSAQTAEHARTPEAIATPWPVVSDWAPAMTGCAAANGRLHQSCLDLSVEWQTFVSRRLCRRFSSAAGAFSRQGSRAGLECLVDVLATGRRGLREGIFRHGQARGRFLKLRLLTRMFRGGPVGRPQSKAA